MFRVYSVTMSSRLVRVLLVATCGLGLAFVSLWPRFQPSESSAQDATANIRLEGQQQSDQLDASVVIENAHNLGGYQFVLSWDSSFASLTNVEASTDFLGSSGRRPYCPDPTTDTAAFRVACATFNALPTSGAQATDRQAPGADGSGTIAEAHFKVLKAGHLDLHLDHVLLVDPSGEPIQSTASDLGIGLHGAGSSSHVLWWITGAVIAIALAVAAGSFARLRSRSASTTGSKTIDDETAR